MGANVQHHYPIATCKMWLKNEISICRLDMQMQYFHRKQINHCENCIWHIKINSDNNNQLQTKSKHNPIVFVCMISAIDIE